MFWGQQKQRGWKFKYLGKNSSVSPQAIIWEPEKISIGDNVQIRAGVVLRPESGWIHIGNNVVINHYTVIHAKGGVEIGDWSVIAPQCGIYAQNHTYASFEQPIIKQPNVGMGITLMADNWLGAGAIILDGVTLGKGTVVGAGTVVNKSFPMAKVIAGNPAKIIKHRFPKDQWDFHSVERFVQGLAPDKYTPFVEERAKYACGFLDDKDKVLDMACGDGYITSIMKKKSPNIVGIDYSEEAVKNAEHKYGIEAYVMSATKLSFEDKSFDKIVCFELLEHLTVRQAAKAVAEAYRILKLNGLIVGSTPVRSTKKSNPSTYSHIYEYSLKELKSLLKAFVDLKIDKGYFIARKLSG